MITAKTDENNITRVVLDGNGKIIKGELCAVIDAYANTASKAFGISKAKVYEITLTEIAEILAKTLEKENRS